MAFPPGIRILLALLYWKGGNTLSVVVSGATRSRSVLCLRALIDHFKLYGGRSIRGARAAGGNPQRLQSWNLLDRLFGR